MKRTRMIVFTIAALVCIGLFPHQQEKVQSLYIPGPEPHGVARELL